MNWYFTAAGMPGHAFGHNDALAVPAKALFGLTMNGIGILQAPVQQEGNTL